MSNLQNFLNRHLIRKSCEIELLEVEARGKTLVT